MGFSALTKWLPVAILYFVRNALYRLKRYVESCCKVDGLCIFWTNIYIDCTARTSHHYVFKGKSTLFLQQHVLSFNSYFLFSVVVKLFSWLVSKIRFRRSGSDVVQYIIYTLATAKTGFNLKSFVSWHYSHFLYIGEN